MSHQPEPVPRALLVGAGALVVASLVGVGFARVTDIGVQRAPELRVVDKVTVVFRDEADGGVGVYDPESNEAVHIFGPGEGGFVRTAMRAVAHTRKVSGAGPEAPFELARTEEGRLLLTDTLTGRTVSLEAFGDANAGDFAQLLDKKGSDA